MILGNQTQLLPIHRSSLVLTFCLLLFMSACLPSPSADDMMPLEIDTAGCVGHQYVYNNERGCDGKVYPDPNSSPYLVPLSPGLIFNTGLTNCSTSFHAPDLPDRYAFDFDVPEGTEFYASREGVVAHLVNDQRSGGGGVGNLVVIDHLDNTFGLYLHSPENGIAVSIGDEVTKGQLLGVTGRSGQAGYPHLHFIVVQNDFQWPYDPIPITFANIIPADVIIKSNSTYKSCKIQ